MRKRLLPTVFAFLSSGTALTAAPVDNANFFESTFINHGALSLTTGLAWAPDGSGRLFVTQKGGECYIVQHGFQAGDPSGTLVATPFMTEPSVFTNSECGLLAVAFDPDFVNNQYVYFFVTVANNQQQIVRYTASGNTGTARTVIVPNLPTNGNNHDGGGLGFGNDGKLYWSIGDLGSKTGVDLDLTSLAAKVGRANRNGTVPNDNPFFDGGGPNNDYIFARGFRNPFTLTFQATTGLLWLNVVGSDGFGQTEPRRGPGYEQVFKVRRGEHAGYDDWENNQPAGFIIPEIAYTTGAVTTLSIDTISRVGEVVTVTTTNSDIYRHPFRRGGRVVIANAGDASFNGTHVVSEDVSHRVFRFLKPGATGSPAPSSGGTATSVKYGSSNGGSSISGGTFYDSTAFPAAYRGNFFFGDYVGATMVRATLDASNNVSSVDLFGTGVGGYIDAATGPDGALYYQGIGDGTIYRLATTSTAQNVIVQPTAFNVLEGGSSVVSVRLASVPAADVNVTVSRTSGDADLTVSSGASLTFTPANYHLPQLVRIAAAQDADVDVDSAIFRVLAAGIASYDLAANGIDDDDPQLVVSVTNLAITEGGSGSFTVRLANAPAGDVSVSVARTGGDSDVSVTGGAALTFTPGNFDSPQTVTIAAADDGDNANDAATITVSTTGQPSRTVAVTVADNDPLAPAFTSTADTTAVDDAAYTYDVNATGNPAPTFSLTTAPAGMSIDAVTGVINWTPTSPGNFSVVVRASNGVLPNATQSFTISVTVDMPPSAILTSPVQGDVLSGTTAEFFGNGVDDVSTVKAEFFVDGVLKSTDVNNENHYHYNGAHLLFNTTLFNNGPHTLRMRVTDTKGQSGETDVQVTIGNGGAKWQDQYFGAGDRRRSFSADPNSDGESNLFEYYSGSDPTIANVGRTPRPDIAEIGGVNYLTLSFVRARWVNDVAARVEATGSLGGPWTQIDPANPTYRVGVANDLPAFGLETVTIRDLAPAGSNPRFMRLRLTK